MCPVGRHFLCCCWSDLLPACLQPSLASVTADTPKGDPIATPVARTYYIQAQEQVWNYAPHGLNRCTEAARHSPGAVFQQELSVHLYI